MGRGQGKTIEQLEKELSGDKEVKETKKRSYFAKMLPTGLYEVQSTSGGRLPDMLLGLFTSGNKVNKLIADFELNK